MICSSKFQPVELNAPDFWLGGSFFNQNASEMAALRAEEIFRVRNTLPVKKSLGVPIHFTVTKLSNGALGLALAKRMSGEISLSGSLNGPT